MGIRAGVTVEVMVADVACKPGSPENEGSAPKQSQDERRPARPCTQTQWSNKQHRCQKERPFA